ncbi:MAG: GNAT family N-acetyltransferase [Chloroflexi bacterium]|nr:GNAT family N-acetyltransferase [Chloroflexota bacterium]
MIDVDGTAIDLRRGAQMDSIERVGASRAILSPMSPTQPVTIRPYHPIDHPAVRALHDRTPAAGQIYTGPQIWPPELHHIEDTTLAFWVATEPSGSAEHIIGMTGVTAIDAGVPPHISMGHSRLVRLRWMRVAPERQRRGIGRQLVQTALDWSRAHNADFIILETTPQQVAAVELYQHMGFREVGRSTIGPYQLVWFEQMLRED